MLGHLWAVVVNLIEIAVVLAMFSAAGTRFETIVVAGLVLIYQAVIFSMATTTVIGIERAVIVARFFLRILRLLNDREVPSDEEGLKEAVERYDAITVRYYINSGGATIVWGIAMWTLLRATF